MAETDSVPVVDAAAETDSGQRVDSLTEREREVLSLLASGASTRAMAEQLGISTYTIRNHLRNIFTKIRVNSRVQATSYAWRHGLL